MLPLVFGRKAREVQKKLWSSRDWLQSYQALHLGFCSLGFRAHGQSLGFRGLGNQELGVLMLGLCSS